MSKLIKIDRLSAWVLFGSMLLYFISGYGMTKGLIDYSLAAKLHLSFLTYIVLISFITHTSFAIHLAFKRWGIWNILGKFVLITFYALFIFFFVYVDRYYVKKPITEKATTSVESKSNTSSNSSSSNSTQNSASVSSEKTFTTSELAQYNGKNGNPAYVAVDGVVYDLTTLFVRGIHHGYSAGQDLSQAFHSQHYESVLNGYPIVGKLQN